MSILFLFVSDFNVYTSSITPWGMMPVFGLGYIILTVLRKILLLIKKNWYLVLSKDLRLSIVLNQKFFSVDLFMLLC